MCLWVVQEYECRDGVCMHVCVGTGFVWGLLRGCVSVGTGANKCVCGGMVIQIQMRVLRGWNDGHHFTECDLIEFTILEKN